MQQRYPELASEIGDDELISEGEFRKGKLYSGFYKYMRYDTSVAGYVDDVQYLEPKETLPDKLREIEELRPTSVALGFNPRMAE